MPLSVHQALSQAGLVPGEAGMLLRQILQCDRAWLISHDEHRLDAAQLTRFEQLCARRRLGEPMAYLLGTRPFFDFQVQVGPGVLIPRHDTELLVEAALQRLPDEPRKILDLGTGSGCIAIALARERSLWQVWAVEYAAAALQFAEQNAQAAALGNLHLLAGSWFEPVAQQRFDMIVSNPPYIAAGDPHLQQGDLRFEPQSALVSGTDGLDDLRHLIAGAPGHLLPHGWLLVEHGFDQGAACRALFAAAGFGELATLSDLGQQPRVTLGQLPA